MERKGRRIVKLFILEIRYVYYYLRAPVQTTRSAFEPERSVIDFSTEIARHE